MPVSDILERLRKRAQTINVPLNKPPERASTSPVLTRAVPNTERVIDPVVARLKAARKRENEAKLKERMEKKGFSARKQPSKSPRATRAPSASKQASTQSRSGARGGGKKVEPPSKLGQQQQPAPKKPKMSFNELMKKASSIDHSKMSINIKPKTKSPDPSSVRSKPDALAKKRSPVPGVTRVKSKMDRPQSKEPTKPASKSTPKTKAPIPIRKPSMGLEQRLKTTREAQYVEDESDDDMSSFIESDDEENAYAKQDYDRDEIWSIFNKGRKRSYYEGVDDDSDDMEATGAEIFEEEMRSKRNALEEDKREMEEEARLAALKKARKR